MVDDQLSVRELLAKELERGGWSEPPLAVAETGPQALQMARTYSPELVVLGLALPGLNAPEVIAAVRGEAPGTKFVIFTGSRNHALLAAGLAVSPQGFVHKTEPLELLREAIEAVVAGKTFWGPYATNVAGEARDGGQGHLSPRQRTVLRLIAEGLSTKQVAAKLGVAPKTVEHYRTQISERLGLRDIASLTRYAIRSGLVE